MILSIQTCFSNLSISVATTMPQKLDDFNFKNIDITSEQIDNYFVATFQTQTKNNQASEIDILLNNILLAYNHQPQQIDRIFCANGPGSFTGVKIGIAFCKGLFLFSEHKINYIPTTFANINFDKNIAHSSYNLSIVDGLMGECYLQVINNNTLEALDIINITLDKLDDFCFTNHNSISGNCNIFTTNANIVFNIFKYKQLIVTKIPTSFNLMVAGLFLLKNANKILTNTNISYVRPAIKN